MLIPSLIEIERELCSRSMVEFVKAAWHVVEPSQPYVHGWHIDAICDHLSAVESGGINRLLINVPPGTMKSMLTGVFFPAWEWSRGKESLRFIAASHEEGLATRDSLKMRRLVTSEWYQSRWPVKLTGDQNQKTYFENERTGWRQACPVRSMTGRRGDRVIWDDPHSVEDSHSVARMAEAERVFRETLPTRLNNPATSAIIIVMQRLAGGDVSDLAIEQGYTHLMLPMEFDPLRKCTTMIGFSDPRTEKNELLFPERFPREVVDRDKAVMGSWAVAAQFQQSPAPREGGLIKLDWFGRYNIAPANKKRIIQSWDTASKGAEHNDPSVCTTWLETEHAYYLLDVYRERVEYPALMRAVYNLHEKWQSDTILIEDKASGQALIQDIRYESKLPIVAINPIQDKVTRLMQVSAIIESGQCMLPERAHWLVDFEHELGIFPNGTHDDQCDSLSMFLGYVQRQKTAVLPRSRVL